MSDYLPLVSIGIPAYKGASKLKRAIESASAQDYPNLEIVISDDASPDDTPAVCQTFCQKDSRIRYIRQPKNLGLTDNFRAVFNLSNGEFFMWLSQDDWIESNYVSTCTNFLLNNPDYALVCGQAKYYDGEKFIGDGVKINLEQNSAIERILSFYAQVLDNGALYSVMRRKLLSKCLLPKSMNGDWVLVASMVFQGKIRTLETVAIHRQNRWLKPIERAKEFIQGEGLPLFQADNPGISAAIAAYRDIAWFSPAYAPLGQLGRFLLAFNILQVFSQKRKVILPSNLLSLISEVNGQYPDESEVAELRKLREKVAEFWLITPTETLSNAYSGNLGKLHQLLLNSGIKDEPLTTTEKAFIREIFAQVSRGFEADYALQYLLAGMLYCYAHQLPLQYEGAPIPKWFFNDYINYILQSPPYFQQIGEIDNYYHHMKRCVARLHANIFNSPSSQLWKETALSFLKNAYFLPLYFTKYDLKDLLIQRAEISEYALKNYGYQLDYVFPERPNDRQKIRLGILKIDFEPPKETFATLPVFEYIDRKCFEIILYTFNITNHPLEQYCSSRVDHLVKLSNELRSQVQTIRADDLDILLIGSNLTAVTNPIFLLTLHRLARLQVTFLTSPVITGMSHIDYYIVGELTAPMQADLEYREKLITIEGSGLCFNNPLPPEEPVEKYERSHWGATDETIVFISGANFYTIIPELIETWAKIIAAVPNSILVLYPFNSNWLPYYPAKVPFINHIRAIFEQYGINKKCLVVIDTLPSIADVKECLKLADIYLDSFPYSGATSLIDALEVGLPTVVMDGNALPFRQAAALLRELEVTDLITTSEENYIKLAFELATNPEMRRQKREQIQQKINNNPGFLDSRSYSQKIGNLFQELFQKHMAPIQVNLEPQVNKKPAIESAEFLNHLRGCVMLYKIDSSDESVLEEIRQIRKQVADFWLSAAPEQLESFYLGNLGKIHQILIESGFLEEQLTEIEENFVDELIAQLESGFEELKTLKKLLAVMLYRRIEQLPIPKDYSGIPQWVPLR
ncbi:MAG: glycosyltransferase [Oscillatoriaceae bacterium SKW80]|nr:glycosyltransferase [Oscillatoriaceae bacterium SKYG93]MCX8122012.1 glycosyltransferase [Oscillatoriaceae bacterium SKW80]MDW8454299.1 glycosyltransferase [Oscillatoriaceae cyanobacterium SKYGB_i_bin93]HIK29164.1 glycosyltransferase [Oscillatoriaceae cyanobacterium M7585_C2015_266]